MQMFIANGTHHNIDFQYRLPEVKRYRQQNIPIGGQIRISGDLSPKDVESIIIQHEIYGMVEASKVSSSDIVIPYVYSLDRPVSAEYIGNLVFHNRQINNELGRRQRQEAAVAVSEQIKSETTDRLNSLEMVIEEVSKTKEPETYETIRVTSDKERGASQDPKKPIVVNRSLF